MSDNTVLDSGTGGDTVVTREISHAGDTAKLQGVFAMGISGTEGAYTAAAINGDATNGLDVDVTRVSGTVTVDGSGVTQPVSHGALTELAAAINSSRVDVNIAASGAIVTVDASGAAVPVTDNSGSLTVDNAGTFAVQATIAAGATTIAKAEDAAHSSGDVGVPALTVRQDTAAALSGTDADYQPLITDSSGRLHVNVGNTVTVGSHAVTNAGTFATQVDGAALTALQLIDNIVAVEDAVAGSGYSGVPFLAVRQDSHSDLAADGDFISPTIDADGGLRVSIVAGAGSGGTALADDAAFTPATTSFTPVGGIVTSDSVDSGDGGAFAMLANRQQKVTLYDSSGVELAVGGGTQYTEDAAAAANPTGNALILVREDARAGSLTTTDGDNVAARGTNAGELYVKHVDAIPVTDNGGALTVDGTVTANLAAGTNNIGDVDVLTLPNVTLAAGTNTNEVVGDAAHDAAAAGNPLLVGAYASAAAPSDVSGDADAVRLWALRNGSLVVNQAIGGSLVTGTTTREVVGDVADDAATGGNPVLVAGVAVETDGTDPTTVSAEGDAAYLRTDRARRLLVSEHHPRSFFTSADYGSAQTNTSIQAAPGAGLSLYITDIIISNGATAGNITLLDGSGGTVKFEIYPAINGGVSISLRQPIRLTANTALCITSTTVTTHSLNIGGYTAP